MASLLTIKTRVPLETIEKIEARLLNDDNDDPSYIVWRDKTVRSEEIKSIVEYDKGKTLVIMYDFEEYLVNEPHTAVLKRWKMIKKDEPEPKGDWVDEDDEEEKD